MSRLVGVRKNLTVARSDWKETWRLFWYIFYNESSGVSLAQVQLHLLRFGKGCNAYILRRIISIKDWKSDGNLGIIAVREHFEPVLEQYYRCPWNLAKGSWWKRRQLSNGQSFWWQSAMNTKLMTIDENATTLLLLTKNTFQAIVHTNFLHIHFTIFDISKC